MFDEALAFTLSHEGGWYDGTGAHDPNPTMKGVTQKTYDAWRKRQGYPPASVRHITNAELRDIYFAGYWRGTPSALEETFPICSVALFDHAVNAGPKMATVVLQRALNCASYSAQIADDGVWGPQTQASLVAFQATRGDADLATLIVGERLAEYVRIARNKAKRAALYAWMTRLADFHVKYIR